MDENIVSWSLWVDHSNYKTKITYVQYLCKDGLVYALTSKLNKSINKLYLN